MRASVRVAWRVAAIAAFAATAALAVTLSRGAQTNAALTSAHHDALARGRAASGIPRCAPSGLRVTLGAGAPAGAATRYPLAFTNVSGRSCALSGYPEVAAYRGRRLVGNAAARDTSVAARRVLLAPGASARAALVASATAGRCRPVAATGLRVVLPGQSATSYLRHPLRACSAAGPGAPVYLRVRPVQA